MKSLLHRSFCRNSLILALLAGAGITTTRAASVAWDANANGGGQVDGAGAWLDPNQWYAAANVNFTNGDDVSFGQGGIGAAVTLSAPVTLGSLKLNTFGETYTLGSAGQSMTINGAITANAGSGEALILSPVNNGGGDLVVGGAATAPDNRDKANVRIDGVLSGGGGLVKNGPGVLWLYAANTYTGPTTVNGGILRSKEPFGVNFPFGTTSAIPTANLTLNGGIIEAFGSETFGRALGNGVNQIQLTGGASGFSEYGSSSFTVQLGGVVPITWGSAFFNPSTLILQSKASANSSRLNFRNPLDLNGAARTIEVNQGDNVTGVFAVMEGTITNTVDTSGLTKTGAGRLLISNASTYNGPTVVNDGIIQFGTAPGGANAIPGGLNSIGGGQSNLELNDGHVVTFAHIRRPLGAGPSQIQLTGGACGFSNGQKDAINFVELNEDPSYEIVWGSPFFQPSSLVLSENEAFPNQALKILNKIDLNGSVRTIAVNGTRSTATDQVNIQNGWLYSTGGYLANDIRNSPASPAGLIKTGPGVLLLGGNNTYNGGTTINDGAVAFNSTTTMPASGTVTVNDGGGLWVTLGGAGGWSTTGSGAGTVHGLLNGNGGQPGSSSIDYNGDITLGFRVFDTQSLATNITDLGTSTSILLTGNGSLFNMTGNNGYTGDTTIEAGTLGVKANAANLGDGTTFLKANTATTPAVLQTSGSYNPTIGSSADLYWSGVGGFAAKGGPLTINANGGPPLVWGAANGFNGKTLQFGSATADAATELTNDITIDANQLIQLFDNPASKEDLTVLSGNIVTNGAARFLTINGAGTLVLDGTNNLGGGGGITLTGGSVLRAIDGLGLPSDSRLTFNGSVFESSGSIERIIFPASPGIFFTGNGGFAAHGGPLNVLLGEDVDPSPEIVFSEIVVDWSAQLGFNNNTLIFGSQTANDVVTLQNNIDLKGDRTVLVNDNVDSTNDIAVFAGVLANGDATPRNLTKTGDGTLLLNGINTYTGITTVSGGKLGGSGSVAGDVTVDATAGLSPGASAGTFGIGGNLDISAPAAGTGMLDFELDAIGFSDLIDVTGSLAIGTGELGLSDFNFTNLGGLEDGIYTLITSVTLVGSLDLTDNTGMLDGADIELQTSGNHIVLFVANVPTGLTYAVWSGGSAADDDDNGDGVKNAVAYALGAEDPDVDASGLLPTFEYDDSGSPTYLVFTFNRDDEAQADETTTIAVEYGSDLSGWTAAAHDPGGTGVIILEAGSDPTNVQVKIPVSLAVDEKIFARLSATVTNP